MKKILISSLFYLCCLSLNAQLVINEVFYNSPDGSPDSIEFIEIYNNDFFDINLSGYTLTDGIEYDFPNINLAGGGYIVLTNDAEVLDAFFGVTGFEWSGSENLSNGGESIVIKDPFGDTIDSLTYDNDEPWPEPASGNGFSMELCGVDSDNSLPGNWFKSENETTASINNVSLKCTPGVVNSVCSPYVNELLFTEIFYNPPGGSGSDSLEYLELYNNGEESIPLDGFEITEGIQFEFPDEELDPGDFILITNNPDALRSTFGIPNGVQIWAYDSGELSNSDDEDIVLVDGNGVLIDEVRYDVTWPYNPLADGDGYSLELCDLNANNLLPQNWKLSSTYAGFEIGVKSIFCSPASDNSPCPTADHVITVNDDNSFTPNSVIIFAGETVEWQLPHQGLHNINGLQSVFNSNPESFFSGEPVAGPWTFSHTFTEEGINQYRCDENFQQGMTGTVTVVAPPYNDIIITEIMYHQPGGDDNYDFVEFYNRSNQIVDLDNYYFADGVEYEFNNISMDPGEYLVVTKDAEAFKDAFGVDAFEWTNGGLNNNGEIITFSSGVELIDIIEFDDDAPWPEIADGEGASIMLCDPESDNNNPFNWRFSTTQTNVATSANPNLYIHATPGAANDSCSTLPSIFFGEDIPVSVSEGVDSFTIKFKMANLGTELEAFVDVVVEGGSTAEGGGIDFELEETTIDFDPDDFGVTTIGRLKIYVNDDTEQEFTERIVIRLQNPQNATLATIGTASIDIIDNDGFNPNLYPDATIGTVTTVDNQGVTDSLGAVVALEGIVYGYNIYPGEDSTGIEFTLIDEVNKEDGIRIYKFNNEPNYEVIEGDKIKVYGYITQFDGLTQLIPDEIELVSQGNALFEADTIFTGPITEAEESKLISLKGLHFDGCQNVGEARNCFVEADNGEVYLMRIDDDTDVVGSGDFPLYFNATGIGSQIDPGTAPYNAGYMFMPRYNTDIETIVSSTKEVDNNLNITVYPNPAKEQLSIYSDVALEQIIVSNMLGQVLSVQTADRFNNQLNIQNLTPGCYLLTCIHQDKMKTLKFVKN
ncbi:MAG: lamin tail domain-containing protein [Saprospiraceae bacterium]